jgi:hypothetical protein
LTLLKGKLESTSEKSLVPNSRVCKNALCSLGSLEELCGLFGKTRQAFYEGGWRKEKESMQAALVLTPIARIRKELPKLGTRKLQFLLQDFFVQHHIKMGRDALFSLLIEEGLLVKKRKRKVSTTNSRHRFRKYPNLVRELELVRSEQVSGCATSRISLCRKASVIYR